MVMLTLWRRADLNNGNQTDPTVTMNGEGTVLGAQSPTLAGYLSKDEDKRLNGDCPWCSAKGQTNTLRSYAVNFTESITLCSSPQCLFPLVSKPLEEVHTSLSSAPSVKGRRRNLPLPACEESNPSPKRRKEAESDAVSEAEFILSGVEENVSVASTELSEEKQLANGQSEHRVVVNVDERACTEASTGAIGCTELCGTEQIEDCVSSTQEEDRKQVVIDMPTPDTVEMVPAWPHLFWRNRDNLCWLDSLLVALVQFRAFREARGEHAGSPVGNLCVQYKKTCAYLKSREQKSQGGAVLVPVSVLQKAEQELAALQLFVFRLLKPKLQCELGQQETPVFALPLLLRTDGWAQSIFQHTATWVFTCMSCSYTLNTRVEKTVTTFTQLVSDWHPLRAVHRMQCNNCHRKNQRRKLVFQKVSSVLALHFVEGLPRKDVSRYSFDLQGAHYDITTIIQYDGKLEHFITWVLQPDGSWLEFDDLRYPHSISHKRFTLPAKQFHLVFWEAQSRKDTPLTEPVLEKDTVVVDSGNEGDYHAMAGSVPNDTCIVDALTVSEDDNKADTRLDVSIGSTTLLDTFEGLSHDDIVTLTLVEVKVDADGKPEGQAARPAERCVTETSAVVVPCTTKPTKSSAPEASSTPAAQEIVLPSVVRPTAPAAAEPQKVQQRNPAGLHSNPTISSMAFLYQQHPSHRPMPLRAPLHPPPPKPDLGSQDGDVLPAKPAELFHGFRAKNSPSPALPGGESWRPLGKAPASHAATALPQKLVDHGRSSAASAAVQAPETWAEKKVRTPSAAKLGLSATDALRLKLMKKLKAKKKKLEKLNQLLGKAEGEAPPRPDSTDVTSLSSVTSSTSACHGPAYDRFFAELLSPATTTSNLSPDSTGLLEILASGQGGETSDSNPQESPEATTPNLSAFELPEPALDNPSSTNDDFLEEFISGSAVQQSTIENTDFNALDMFF